MSRHRLERPRRARGRQLRLGTAALSSAVTLVALLAGIGVLPLQNRPPASAEAGHQAGAEIPRGLAAAGPAVSGEVTTKADGKTAGKADSKAARGSARVAPARTTTALPVSSGTGRRVVFDMSEQRVWLVDASGRASSTYLVSGSVTHNLDPGSYSVYSRSRWAVGVDDSGVMQYFVRFAHGPHAAIGFHTIPTKLGHPLQTVAQLGTPQSHGCIRQALPDALLMWSFAQVGTSVVVTA